MSGGRLENISQSLPIPEHKVGWVVGKKGSYINQLGTKSGATISISESTSREYGIIWKYVQISGPSRAVDRAKKLLHIRLDRMEPRATGCDPDSASASLMMDGDEKVAEEGEEDLIPTADK